VVYVGTSGYSYDDWVGPFYPPGLPKSDFLTHYAERFQCVEINMTYYPNLYGDLSDASPWNALARDPDYGPKFLTEFQDRMLFGTDLCFPTMPIDIIGLLIDWRDTGKISVEVFNKVARENAIKLLGLE